MFTSLEMMASATSSYSLPSQRAFYLLSSSITVSSACETVSSSSAWSWLYYSLTSSVSLSSSSMLSSDSDSSSVSDFSSSSSSSSLSPRLRTSITLSACYTSSSTSLSHLSCITTLLLWSFVIYLKCITFSFSAVFSILVRLN